MSSSSTRSRSRTRSTSASAPRSTTTTTSSSSSSTAPRPTRTASSRCTASTPSDFLVTVHRDDCPAFPEIRERYAKRAKPIERPALLLYRIIDGLVDSFFPILADFDDRIDELENEIFLHADDAQLQEIFAMKRLLVGMRKAITPAARHVREPDGRRRRPARA